jgi:hypothetical protein
MLENKFWKNKKKIMQNESEGHTMCILISNEKQWTSEVVKQMYLEMQTVGKAHTYKGNKKQ